jgi:hypothetical protein
LKELKKIDEKQLILIKKIGTGAFSDVFMGKLKIKNTNNDIFVAVKVRLIMFFIEYSLK